MPYRDNFLALPEDVLAFAWSAPLRELSQKVGISDVGLKKLLRAQGIETPPQGHWNRVHAGKKVKRPPKPRPRGPGESGRIKLDNRFEGHVRAAENMPVDGPFATEKVPEDLEELRSGELKAIGKVTVPRELSRPHPGLEQVLRLEEKRRAKFAESGWSWDEPQHDHPLAQRQLRIADSLLKALAKRGHAGKLSECDTGFELLVAVGDRGITLVLERSPARLGGAVPRNDRDTKKLPASAPLRIGLRRTWSRNELAQWQDRDGQRLEQQLAEIAASAIMAGEASFRQSLAEAVEAEKQRLAWLEAARLREVARLEEKRLAGLKASGELLRQAEEIRTLVSRVEAAIVQRTTGEITPERVERWKHWALAKADELDPVLSGQVLTHLHVAALDD